MKKVELERVNAVLKDDVLRMEKDCSLKMTIASDEILKLREEFTNIITGSYSENSKQPWLPSPSSSTKKPLSWEEIFFKFGELNSNANYSLLLEAKRNLENVIQGLNIEIEAAKVQK